MRESLSHHALRGVMWSAVERFSVQGIQFVLSIVIARLVLPSEYGLIAMQGIFLAIAQTFVDSGFSNALIQKKDRTEVDYSTVFYFNILIALVVYGVLFISAPYIASFYREPELTAVTRWMGLNVMLNAFLLVQRTRLLIASDFRTLAKTSLIAVIISGGIGVCLAWLGYGVWALIAQSLGNTFLNMMLLWWFVAWGPQRTFSMVAFRKLFTFGSRLLLGGLLHTVYLNLYTLVIGRFFNPMQVGYFNRSQTLAVFPATNLTEIVNRTMYPALCTLQHDEEALIRTFFNYLRSTLFIVFPLMIGLAIMSETLIEFLLSEKWLPAAPFMSILCIAYMWYPIMVFNWQLLNVKGRSDLSLKAEIIKKIGAFTILFVSIPWGMNTICWGLLAYSLFDLFTISFFVGRIYPFDLRKEIVELLPIGISTLLMGLLMYISLFLTSVLILRLVIGMVVGIFSYLFFCYLFKLKELKFIKQILNKV